MSKPAAVKPTKDGSLSKSRSIGAGENRLIWDALYVHIRPLSWGTRKADQDQTSLQVTLSQDNPLLWTWTEAEGFCLGCVYTPFNEPQLCSRTNMVTFKLHNNLWGRCPFPFHRRILKSVGDIPKSRCSCIQRLVRFITSMARDLWCPELTVSPSSLVFIFAATRRGP